MLSIFNTFKNLSEKYRKKFQIDETLLNELQNKLNDLNAVVAYNKYGAYCLPKELKYRPAVKKVIKGNVYEPKTIEFLRNNSGTGDIVHAGTFFGDFLPGISKGISDKGTIWAFEPNLHSFQCAETTIGLNNIKNIELTNAGLGMESSNANMEVMNEDGILLGGASKIVNNSNGTIENIQIVSIDDIVPKNRTVSIIQLDVEGYEQQAISGALQTIERCKPILILEDNDGIIKGDWFQQHILKKGYKVVGKIHHNTLLRCVS